jgi:hypothetical protein
MITPQKSPMLKTPETTHTKIDIPRRSFSPVDHVKLSMPMGTNSESPSFELCLASVRMESLPRDIFWQRLRGNVKSIYVKGVPQDHAVSAPSSE